MDISYQHTQVISNGNSDLTNTFGCPLSHSSQSPFLSFIPFSQFFTVSTLNRTLPTPKKTTTKKQHCAQKSKSWNRVNQIKFSNYHKYLSGKTSNHLPFTITNIQISAFDRNLLWKQTSAGQQASAGPHR